MNKGFSFIELIVVLTLLALLSGAVIPMYAGSIKGMQREHAVRDVVSILKYAQERAITDVREHRVYFNPDTKEYWLMRLESVELNKKGHAKKNFEESHENIASRRYLPDRLKMLKPDAPRDREKGDEKGAYYVAFFPNGACTNATLKFKLEGRHEHMVTIETEGSLGRMKVKE